MVVGSRVPTGALLSASSMNQDKNTTPQRNGGSEIWLIAQALKPLPKHCMQEAYNVGGQPPS